jgi:hypothetical protein
MTYWARSNSFEFDDEGERAIGAKIYFFDAGTSTPRATYSDAALSVANTHPVVADGNGRWPKVFLQYGSYKETATTAGGTTLWTTDDIPNPAPTDPGEGVAADAIYQTGDTIFSFKNGTREGFTRCNGRTIGSAASGGTERANADCQNQFLYLWNNLGDFCCPVSGGRGANAAADWAANKAIGMPDLRGSVPGGLDDMGNSAASRFDASVPISAGQTTTAGSVAGLNHHTLLTAQMPVTTPAGSINQVTGTISQVSPVFTGTAVAPTGSVSVNDARTFTVPNTAVSNIPVGGSNVACSISGGGAQITPVTIAGSITGSFTGDNYTPAGTIAPITPTFTGSTPTFTGTAFGSGSAHNNTQRTVLGTWLMKL